MGREELNRLSGVIVGAAVKVHERVGPGLLESVYESLLTDLLIANGVTVCRQKAVSLSLDGHTFDTAFRPDLLVQDAIIVEVKCVESIAPVHTRQLLTYLRLLDLRLGLLVNFGVAYLPQGIRRIVNNF